MKIIAILLLAVTTPLCAQPENQPRDPAEGFMLQFDRNHDDKVSLDEFKQPQVQSIDEQFTYMDKNGDGDVDKAEVTAFAEEMKQRMQQRQRQYQQQDGGDKR